MTPRRTGAAGVAALAAALAAAAIPVVLPAGTAHADVCAGAGRRVHVSGCANIADAVAPYAPAPEAYAPLPGDPPPNVYGCVGWNGRWVSANQCN